MPYADPRSFVEATKKKALEATNYTFNMAVEGLVEWFLGIKDDDPRPGQDASRVEAVLRVARQAYAEHGQLISQNLADRMATPQERRQGRMLVEMFETPQSRRAKFDVTVRIV